MSLHQGLIGRPAAVPAAALAAALCALLALGATLPSRAMVGGAPLAEPQIARHVILIVGSRGNYCTGTVIGRDLILTAAHCVQPGAEYKWVQFNDQGQPGLWDVAAIATHPQFNLKELLGHRATADVALLRTAKPLPSDYAPVPYAPVSHPVVVGDQFLVVGYGVTVRGDGRTGGKVRAARLAATGQPGTLQIRLVDPATNNAKPGLGACTGDSGAPVFQVVANLPTVIGIVSWSTGPQNQDGCGGLTGVTPLERYYPWITETGARPML